MKKLLVVLLLGLMCLTGCSKNNAKYTVGIVQLAKHNALDKATQGFIDELKDELGEDVYILEPQVAAGNPDTCSTMATGLVADGVDLIMGNATSALLSVANATKQQKEEDRIPVLGTSITDYDSLPLGDNVSGTSDYVFMSSQAENMLELFPNAKNIGLLYCLSETNSKYQIDEMEKCLLEMNPTLNVVRYGFTDANELQNTVTVACDESDIIYIPTDNTCADNGGIIAPIANEKGVPIYAGEESTLKAVEGVATLSIDYYELGRMTGKMAAKILTGESKVSDMPIEYFENPVKLYIKENADKYGLTMPLDYQEIIVEE